MAVTFVSHLQGLQEVPNGQPQALAAALSGLPNPIVIDASEGEGRTLATIVAFIQGGGIWVSWGGYPFYYTPSQSQGSGYNFSRFCQLLGVPDPNAANKGVEFFGPPGGQTRVLWTPTATLPTPWVSGQAPFQVGNQYVWPLIAVPSGSGWWCYASPNYGVTTAAPYAAFIQSLVSPPAATTTPSTGPSTGVIVGVGLGAIGLGVVLYLATRH
jgi:hypothetical protein